jgi:prephenate dehydrogenase
MTPRNIAVIGLGCIGGSILRALPRRVARARGWSASSDDRALAREIGYDVPDSLADTLEDASIVVIAVPVQAIGQVMQSISSSAPQDATILHCGGVQSREALGLDEEMYARMRGTHPLAGSQDSGFNASRADLFEGCAVSVERRSMSVPAPEQEEHIRWLWGQLGATRLEYRTSAEHDALMAWISQLPQLASTALAAAFAAEHIDPKTTGPGARDTTRLAASAFEQWVSLLQAQPRALDDALAALQASVGAIRDALANGDQRMLRRIWDAARDWRRSAEPSA